MKSLLILITAMLFSLSSMANEVITVNGQKLVLFKLSTAKEVSQVFQMETDDSVKIESLKRIFAKEKTYCQAAAETFENESLEEKWNKLLTKKYFYEMMLNDTPAPTTPKEFQLILSQFFTLTLLF